MPKKIDPAGVGSCAAVGEGASGPVLVVDGGVPGNGPAGTDRGEFLVVEAPRCIAVSWGFGGDDQLPAGSSRVEFLLSPVATGTRVDLHHFDLPDTTLTGHGDGRRHLLPRLKAAAARANPDRMTGGHFPRKHTRPSRTLNREELCP